MSDSKFVIKSSISKSNRPVCKKCILLLLMLYNKLLLMTDGKMMVLIIKPTRPRLVYNINKLVLMLDGLMIVLDKNLYYF